MKTLNVPRPTERDEAVLEAAIEMIMPSVWDWITALDNYDSEEREGVRLDLKKAIGRSCISFDGYQLARNLEQVALWEPDSELVDVLDSFQSFVNKVHRDAVKAWVVEQGIIPQHRVPDEVLVRIRGVEYQGVVIRVDAETAQYTVNIQDLGHTPLILIKNIDGSYTPSTQRPGALGVILPVEEVDD